MVKNRSGFISDCGSIYSAKEKSKYRGFVVCYIRCCGWRNVSTKTIVFVDNANHGRTQLCCRRNLLVSLDCSDPSVEGLPPGRRGGNTSRRDEHH